MNVSDFKRKKPPALKTGKGGGQTEDPRPAGPGTLAGGKEYAWRTGRDRLRPQPPIRGEHKVPRGTGAEPL